MNASNRIMIFNNAANTRRRLDEHHRIVQQNMHFRRNNALAALRSNPPDTVEPVVPELPVLERLVCHIYEDTVGMWSIERPDGVRVPLCVTDDRLKAGKEVGLYIYRER